MQLPNCETLVQIYVDIKIYVAVNWNVQKQPSFRNKRILFFPLQLLMAWDSPLRRTPQKVSLPDDVHKAREITNFQEKICGPHPFTHVSDSVLLLL